MINFARSGNTSLSKVAIMRMLVTGFAIFTLAACASAPPSPLQEIQAADLVISRAEQSQASNYAALELNQAREKIAAARAAVQQEDMILARQLAEASRAKAELAIAKAEMLQAREVNEDMKASIETLKQEIFRNTGARQ